MHWNGSLCAYEEYALDNIHFLHERSLGVALGLIFHEEEIPRRPLPPLTQRIIQVTALGHEIIQVVRNDSRHSES